MSDNGQSAGGRAGRRAIDGEAKAAFLALVRGGTALAGAAGALGFSLDGFYGARARDPLFRAGWGFALELAGLEARRRRGAGRASAPDAQDAEEGVRLTGNNRRQVQLRRLPHVRFTPHRQAEFLGHFAASADATAAAAAVGVCESTVYKLRRRDADFRAGFQEALDESYVRLEAEALRQRLAAQRVLAEAPAPSAEMAAEFERVMKLLQRWDRRGTGPGLRARRHGQEKVWSFEQAIAALDRKLDALGARGADDAGAVDDAGPEPS